MTCKLDCPECSGTGFFRYDVSLDDPRFGKLYPCPNVPAEELFDFAKHGINQDEIAGLKWKALKNTPHVKPLKDAVDKLLSRGYGWLFVWGAPGLTKTVALKIAVLSMLQNKEAAAYVRMADILENLRSVYAEGGDGNAEAKLAYWQKIPLLAIDEFDRARDTEFAQEKRFALMDDRYVTAIRQKSMTILAANQDPQEFDNYLADRIYDGRFQVVHLEGTSLRPALEWAK